MIKPILPFNAVIQGSPYPKTFTPNDEFEVGSETARIALELGRLSDEDAERVRDAFGLPTMASIAGKEAEVKAAKEAAVQAIKDAAVKEAKEAEDKAAAAKAKGVAPENKAK
ncbi:MAG: hypothetical protein ABJL99_10115 [Aliishimia sp.]